jgi:hypothetical protein
MPESALSMVNDLWRRLIAGTLSDIGTPRPSWGDGTAPDSLDRAGVALSRRHKALEEAGLNVLFVTNSECIDNYWSPWLKRLANGQTGKRRDFLYLNDLKHGLWVLGEFGRRRASPAGTEAAE